MSRPNKDLNFEITNTATLTFDLKIQGHGQFCMTFYISICIHVIREISVYIFSLLRPGITIILQRILRDSWLTFKFKVTGNFS